MDDTKIQLISTESLHFDNRNPRLVEFNPRTKTEDEILNLLWYEMDVEEIVKSILANGFFNNEALLAVKEDNKTVVVEGNRRLAAVKSILNPERVAGMKKYLGKIPESLAESLRTLPVIIRMNRKESWGYIGFKHVNGPAKWGSYAKAQYIATVHNDFGVSIAEISEQIGDNNQTVLKLYQGLMVIQQAEKDTEFRRDDIDAQRLYFSHLYTGLQQQGFQKFLGLEEKPKDSVSPVPKSKLDNLQRVMDWLFGSKNRNIKPVIRSQNPDLGHLSSILNNETATATLIATGDLDMAFETSIGSTVLFQNCLVEAKVALKKAHSNIDGYGGEVDILEMAKTVSTLASRLLQTMNSVRTEQSADMDDYQA